MARIVITTSADADAETIPDYLNARAGQSTVIKYRALFRKLYERFYLECISLMGDFVYLVIFRNSSECWERSNFMAGVIFLNFLSFFFF